MINKSLNQFLNQCWGYFLCFGLSEPQGYVMYNTVPWLHEKRECYTFVYIYKTIIKYMVNIYRYMSFKTQHKIFAFYLSITLTINN